MHKDKIRQERIGRESTGGSEGVGKDRKRVEEKSRKGWKGKGE